MSWPERIVSWTNKVKLSFEDIMKQILPVRQNTKIEIEDVLSCSFSKTKKIYKDIITKLISTEKDIMSNLRWGYEIHLELTERIIQKILGKYKFLKSWDNLNPSKIKQWIQSIREKGIHNIVAKEIEFGHDWRRGFPSLDFKDGNPPQLIIITDVVIEWSTCSDMRNMRRLD